MMLAVGLSNAKSLPLGDKRNHHNLEYEGSQTELSQQVEQKMSKVWDCPGMPSKANISSDKLMPNGVHKSSPNT